MMDAYQWAMDYEIWTGHCPPDSEIMAMIETAKDRRRGVVLIEGEFSPVLPALPAPGEPPMP